MTTAPPIRARSRRWLAALAAGLIAISGGIVTATSAVADAVPTVTVTRGIVLDIPARVTTAAEGCPVDGATLTWGFKESFRSYISGSIANGEWTVADGATYSTPDFGWSNGKGAYDPSTGLITFPGSITFTGHGGVLNTTVANPQLKFLDDDTAILLLDVSGTTQEGAPIDLKGVEFVELDLSAATVDGTDAALEVAAAPATLTASGSQAFGTYEAGESFDPVSFVLPLDADCATPFTATDPDVEQTSSTGDLWWILWVVLALILAAIVATVIVVRRRSRAA